MKLISAIGAVYFPYTCKFILKLCQRDKQITFLSEVYENTCENQAKSADFSANFSLKIP